MVKKMHEAQYKAAQHDGICLSDEYVDNQTKMKWQCKVGHIFQASFNSVQQGHWCKTCSVIERANRLAHSIEDAQKLAPRT